jgi:hypothetical protein
MFEIWKSDGFNSNSYMYPPVPKFGKVIDQEGNGVTIKGTLKKLYDCSLNKLIPSPNNFFPHTISLMHSSIIWRNYLHFTAFLGRGRVFTVTTFRISKLFGLSTSWRNAYMVHQNWYRMNFTFDTQNTVIGIQVNSEIWCCDLFLHPLHFLISTYILQLRNICSR